MKPDTDMGNLAIIGCGKMGSALLRGWLAAGVPPSRIFVREPSPSPWLIAQAEPGITLNGVMPEGPAALILATKPQMVRQVLGEPGLTGHAPPGFVLSVAAGIPIAIYEEFFGAHTPVIRAMPNLPALIGAGVSALVGNEAARGDALSRAGQLLGAVGEVVFLQNEGQMHGVTALSGSGPAYLFAFAEALADAGAELGLERDISFRLAGATLRGAAQMLTENREDVAQMRRDVSSPGGTTLAALDVLNDSQSGLCAVLRAALKAAHRRSVELGRES